MKNYIVTVSINEAIYNYDSYNKIKDSAYWGESIDGIKAIDGKVAMKDATAKGINICGGGLQEGVLYVFRRTLKGDKLVPYHVTMLPKTTANVYKGSCRYGSAAIMAELR